MSAAAPGAEELGPRAFQNRTFATPVEIMTPPELRCFGRSETTSNFDQRKIYFAIKSRVSTHRSQFTLPLILKFRKVQAMIPSPRPSLML